MDIQRLKTFLYEEHYNKIQFFLAAIFLFLVLFPEDAAILLRIPIGTIKVIGIFVAIFSLFFSISAFFARTKK
ncbi:hypothetical protein IJU97_02875 [bacterium]|nr:hypothetical protein [bacterium]